MRTCSSKKPSPAAPSFILNVASSPLTWIETVFSLLLRTLSFPNLTWNGVHISVPSSCSMTITSMQPLRVALGQVREDRREIYLIEFKGSRYRRYKSANIINHIFISSLFLIISTPVSKTLN